MYQSSAVPQGLSGRWSLSTGCIVSSPTGSQWQVESQHWLYRQQFQWVSVAGGVNTDCIVSSPTGSQWQVDSQHWLYRQQSHRAPVSGGVSTLAVSSAAPAAALDKSQQSGSSALRPQSINADDVPGIPCPIIHCLICRSESHALLSIRRNRPALFISRWQKQAGVQPRYLSSIYSPVGGGGASQGSAFRPQQYTTRRGGRCEHVPVPAVTNFSDMSGVQTLQIGREVADACQ